MTHYWIGVAAADHIARGVEGGFMQVNHGKLAPLKRMSPGDVVAYYSPVKVYGGDEKLQAFTAIGVVKDAAPYEGEMGSFKAFRRDIGWHDASPSPIQPLLEALSFTQGQKSWGYKFRFGFFEIEQADMEVIAKAMGQTDI
ncbi:EVE domain-containing protein [Aestuariivirga litoralis]|uniref:EVE domain-containing protein n=1 Tax=Aestuariivirga litoralis TaxID=2650924 RepID=UPI0018C6E2FC|nr:EVE domain-containing protein [Aestuariivirga litoralis]